MGVEQPQGVLFGGAVVAQHQVQLEVLPPPPAMGVMVLWGVSPVKARMSALSSEYPRQLVRILSARSTRASLSAARRRMTDMGHFTMLASTFSKPGKQTFSRTGALAMGNS